jgi:dienelactone hydrolase
VKHSLYLLLTLVVLLLVVFITSCGGGSNSTAILGPVTVSVTQSVNNVQPGGTVQLTATVTNDPNNQGVNWIVSCPASPCGTVSPMVGTATTYTAPSSMLPGGLAVTITATSVASSSASVTAMISIFPDTITINVANPTVPINTTEQLTATVAYDPANKGVTWTVSCPTAPCGSVSPTTTLDGMPTTYTAPTVYPAGDLQVIVTATSVANAAILGSVTLTVPGTTISITQSTGTAEAGSTVQLTATVTNDPTNQGVTWSVSCSQPVPCGTISPSPTLSGNPTTYTAPPVPPPSNLQVTVTATSVFNTAVTNFATVSVPAIKVSVTPSGALLPLNTVLQFTATVANDPSNGGVTWAPMQNGAACSPACGTASPTSTLSGTPTTFTAPATAPATPGVAVTATSVEDTTKSAIASVTISSGTVELVPNGVNFGSAFVNGTGRSEQVTLTNTGTTALTINGITMTGTDPADFSQTNNCGMSVPAAGSCTLTLTFKPKSGGTRSADVSIRDSSSDSPQQIGLSGTGVTRRGAFLEPRAQSALAANRVAAVPSPEGPETVGTRVMNFVDSARKDPYLTTGARRELLVRFWYPASHTQECKPAAYTSPRVWNYFSQLVGVRLPDVTTNTCQDAPLTDGKHPIVVFTPGYTATFTDYTFLLEDLASRGYVVASVDHTYEATAVEFADGRLVTSIFGSHLAGKLQGDDHAFAFATSVRLEDLRFVVDELKRMNAQANSPFAAKLDLARVAVAGHSMGGTTAFLALESDPRLKAAILIDAHVPDTAINPTQRPILILAMGSEKWSEDRCRLWSNLRGPRLAVNFLGAEHVTPSDAVWLARDAINTGSMGPDGAIAAVRNFIAAFLDTNLLSRPRDSLLNGESSTYPGAAITTRTQLLCVGK